VLCMWGGGIELCDVSRLLGNSADVWSCQQTSGHVSRRLAMSEVVWACQQESVHVSRRLGMSAGVSPFSVNIGHFAAVAIL
jgi:hypothetical protein